MFPPVAAGKSETVIDVEVEATAPAASFTVRLTV